MTPRDTLNPSVFPNSSSCPVPPDDCQAAGIDAANRYLDQFEIVDAEPPPSLWQSVLAAVLIVALVAVALWGGMAWWQATTVGVVMSAGACLAWGGVVAEAGRDAGVVR